MMKWLLWSLAGSAVLYLISARFRESASRAAARVGNWLPEGDHVRIVAEPVAPLMYRHWSGEQLRGEPDTAAGSPGKGCCSSCQ